MVKAVQAHPSSVSLPQQEVSCCSDLTLRVQAVWDAFCALMAAVVDWCATQIHGEGIPCEIDDELPSMAPAFFPPPPTLVEELTELLKDPYIGKSRWCRTDDLSSYRPIEEKMKRIKKDIIDGNKLLIRVANTQHTRPGDVRGYTLGHNRTRLLLELGANPNEPLDQFQYVPLHGAVLSGSCLAYTTLREGGAKPWMRHAIREDYENKFWHFEVPDSTPLEVAYQIIASEKSLENYFSTIATQKLSWIVEYFPPEHFSKHCSGSVDDVRKMIDYEVELATNPIHEALVEKMPRPIAKIVASYYLSGNPCEWGGYLVESYLKFNVDDPNSDGVKKQLKANPGASVKEQLDMIRKSVEASNELFMATNCRETYQERNETELFLQLGANPNIRGSMGKLHNFTPLHAAVLTRCPRAYKILRAWGADPTVKMEMEQEKDTCIELAHKMFARPQKEPYRYFNAFMEKAGLQKKKDYDSRKHFTDYNLVLFPAGYEASIAYRIYKEHGFGTDKDLQEIIDYEVDLATNPIHAALADKIARPIAQIIASYYI